MNTMYTLMFIGLFIWIPWFWRYRIQLYIQRNTIRSKLSAHPQKEHYLMVEQILTKTYRYNKAPIMALKNIFTLQTQHVDFTYGEIDFLSFITLLEKAAPQPHEIFVDLGCGAGKAVLAAALSFNFSKVVGIELLPHLCAQANERLKKALTIIKPLPAANQYLPRLKNIQIINDDFNHYDIAQCHVLFINATCFCPETWSEILNRLTRLNTGARVILTSRTLPPADFQLVYQGRTLMSWGMNSVRIYQKLNS